MPLMITSLELSGTVGEMATTMPLYCPSFSVIVEIAFECIDHRFNVTKARMYSLGILTLANMMTNISKLFFQSAPNKYK